MKLRAVIVDDEELARQILREYLDKAGDVLSFSFRDHLEAVLARRKGNLRRVFADLTDGRSE